MRGIKALTCETHKAQEACNHRFQLPVSSSAAGPFKMNAGAHSDDDDVVLDEEKDQSREQDARAAGENVECEVGCRWGMSDKCKGA